MSTVGVPEAAGLMKVHPRTVLDLIDGGFIPACKVGRAYVMLTRDVMAYIESLIVKQTAERMGVPYGHRNPSMPFVMALPKRQKVKR